MKMLKRFGPLMLKAFGLLLLAGFVWLAGPEFGERPGGKDLVARSSIFGVNSFVPTAEARVGRPLTPVSVSGVARRTARRNY